MTTRRLPSAKTFTVAVALLTLLAARPALAEGSTASEPAAEGERAARAPDASVAAPPPARPWLRAASKPARAVAAAAPSPSPWRALAVLVVLGALGGAVLVARRRRSAAPALPESATRVRVLSSARVGPKANAVVAEVGGRVMLLGVTDTNVARLAWLDRPAREAAPEPEPQIKHHTLSRQPVETADADVEPPPERGMAARFGEVLDRALGVRPASNREFRGNPGVAALLAGNVEDVVEARGASRTTTQRLGSSAQIIIEDQVAGLKRSRRRS
jgi:flagellar biogenesis protein FliO